MNTIRQNDIGSEHDPVPLQKKKKTYRFSSNNRILATASVIDVSHPESRNAIKNYICRIFTRQFWNPRFEDAKLEQQFLEFRDAIYAKKFSYRGIALLVTWLYVLYAVLTLKTTRLNLQGGLVSIIGVSLIAVGGIFYCMPYFCISRPFRRQNVILPVAFYIGWILVVGYMDLATIISTGRPLLHIDGYQIALGFIYGMLPSTQLNVTILAVALSTTRGASINIGFLLFREPYIFFFETFVHISSHVLGIRLKKRLESSERENFWLRTCDPQVVEAEAARGALNPGHSSFKYSLHNTGSMVGSKVSLQAERARQVSGKLKIGTSRDFHVGTSRDFHDLGKSGSSLSSNSGITPRVLQVPANLKTSTSKDFHDVSKSITSLSSNHGIPSASSKVRRVAEILKTGTSRDFHDVRNSKSSLASSPGITISLAPSNSDSEEKAKQGEDPTMPSETTDRVNVGSKLGSCVSSDNAPAAVLSPELSCQNADHITASSQESDKVLKCPENTVGVHIFEPSDPTSSGKDNWETQKKIWRSFVFWFPNWMRYHFNLKDSATSAATWSAYETYCNKIFLDSWTTVLVLVILRETFNVLLTHNDELISWEWTLAYVGCLAFIVLSSYAVKKFVPKETHINNFQAHIVCFQIVLSLAYALFYIAKKRQISPDDIDQAKLLSYNYVMSIFFLHSTAGSSRGCRTITQFYVAVFMSFGSLVLFCRTSTIPVVHWLEIMITLCLNLAILRTDEGYFLDTWRLKEHKTSLCDVLGSRPLDDA